MLTHTHTYTHSHTLSHSHTYTHTHIHNSNTGSHSHIHTHSHIHIVTLTTHIHMLSHTHTLTQLTLTQHIYSHSYIHTQTHTLIHTLTTHTLTLTHTHTHTPSHIHIHTDCLPLPQAPLPSAPPALPSPAILWCEHRCPLSRESEGKGHTALGPGGTPQPWFASLGWRRPSLRAPGAAGRERGRANPAQETQGHPRRSCNPLYLEESAAQKGVKGWGHSPLWVSQHPLPVTLNKPVPAAASQSWKNYSSVQSPGANSI